MMSGMTAWHFAGYQQINRSGEKSECLSSRPGKVLLRRWAPFSEGLEQIDVLGEQMAEALERVMESGLPAGFRVVEVDAEDPLVRHAVETGDASLLRAYAHRLPIRGFTVQTLEADNPTRATLRSDGVVLVEAADDSRRRRLARALLECALNSSVVEAD
jgi:hypothetical protein